MSRPLRIEFPNACYYVMNRGIGRRAIFNTEAHHRMFLDLLNDLHQQFNVKIFAYCLMDNHYHLLLQTPLGNLSKAMQYLNGRYTQRYNRMAKKEGVLFRGRYKASIVDADSYLLPLSRYIHLNPVKAKMISNPKRYKWSSYQAYLRMQKKPKWLSCEEVLSRCSKNQSVLQYQHYIETAQSTKLDELFDSKQTKSILGDASFIDFVKEKVKSTQVNHPEIPQGKKLKRKTDSLKTIKDWMSALAKYFNTDIEELRQRGHRYQENHVRNMAIYFVGKYCGYTNSALADFFGELTYSAVSQIKRRIHARVLKNKFDRAEVNKLAEYFQMSNVKI